MSGSPGRGRSGNGDPLFAGVNDEPPPAQDKQFAGRAEKRRRMQSAGSSKDRLRLAQSWRQLAEQFRIEQRSSLGMAQTSPPELRYRRLPAHAARRPRRKSARRAIRREAHAGIERHAHEISLGGGIAWHPQRHQILSPGNDAFGKEKSGNEFLVVSRRAKGNTQGVPSRSHLQRLFGCEVVFYTRGLAILPLDHLREFDIAAFLGHWIRARYTWGINRRGCASPSVDRAEGSPEGRTHSGRDRKSVV